MKRTIIEEMEAVLKQYPLWQNWFKSKLCPLSEAQKDAVCFYLQRYRLQKLLELSVSTKKAQWMLLDIDVQILKEKRSMNSLHKCCLRALEALKVSEEDYRQFYMNELLIEYKRRPCLLDRAKAPVYAEKPRQIRKRKKDRPSVKAKS